jgi:hypothetical protein
MLAKKKHIFKLEKNCELSDRVSEGGERTPATWLHLIPFTVIYHWQNS